MPTLTECGDKIRILKGEKGFNADLFFFKLVWGMIELGEAMDLVKKNGLPSYKEGPTTWIVGENDELMELIGKLGTEIVDVVFYMTDAYSLLKRRYPWLTTMDETFEAKLQKNMDRPKTYGQKWMDDFLTSAIDQWHDEGILNEMVMMFMKYAATKTSSGWPEPTKEAYAPIRLGGKKENWAAPTKLCTECVGQKMIVYDGEFSPSNCRTCKGEGRIPIHSDSTSAE